MDIITCPTAQVLHMQTVLLRLETIDTTLLPTAVVQHGEIAGYSLQEQVLPSTADITTSEALQDV